MALPDITTLTGDELQALAVQIATRQQQQQTDAATAHETARTTVATILTDLDAEITRAQTVLDTTNATINSGPAPYIKDVARATKRVAQASKDLARFVRNL